MKQSFLVTILIVGTLLFTISCNKNDNNDLVKQEKGAVWLSGGLAHCAIQIHLDNGDKLIVDLDGINSFKSGDRVVVKYKEIRDNEFCSPAIDSDIIDIQEE